MYILFKQFQRHRGLTPAPIPGFVKAETEEEVKVKLGLNVSIPSTIQGKRETGYKKTEKHKTVFYIKKSKKPVEGEEITSI